MCKAFLEKCHSLHPRHHLLCAVHFWLLFSAFKTDPPLALQCARRLLLCLEAVVQVPWNTGLLG